jgi:Ca2+-binding RTX toxin-like protein
MHLDRLEGRTLFAASVSMVDGVVAIRGSSGADIVVLSTHLDVRKSANRVAHNDLDVTINGQTTSFDASQVTAIVAKLGGGNDKFQMKDVALPRTIHLGNHRLVTHANWTVDVDGGDGNDRLVGSAGNETFHGGTGADSMNGGAGDDAVYGDDGNDLLTEDGGVDRLDGGHGDDTIVLVDCQIAKNGRYTKVYGGNGNDEIYRLNLERHVNIKGYFSRLVEHTHNVVDDDGMAHDPSVGWRPVDVV